MNKDLLILEVKEALIDTYSNGNPLLVDFWDHEVHWDKIAKIAVETVLSETEILQHDDKTIDKIREILETEVSPNAAKYLIHLMQNEGILFRERVPNSEVNKPFFDQVREVQEIVDRANEKIEVESDREGGVSPEVPT